MTRKQADVAKKATTSGNLPRYVIRVELTGTEPLIWRSLELAGSLTLADLNACIQASLAWENSHLHEFARVGPGRNPKVERFNTGFELMGAPGDAEGPLESKVKLGDVFRTPGDALAYTYDFGDNWEHDVRL